MILVACDAAVDDDALDAGLLQPPHQLAHVLRGARTGMSPTTRSSPTMPMAIEGDDGVKHVERFEQGRRCCA